MPGTFIFRPIEANLTHDTDWLGKMDPYCAYMMNNKRIKGQVCKSGGQHPIWNDATTVPMEVDQPACVVELMDKDKFIDDSIGTFVIDLTEVQNHGTVSKWYPVFHKNKPAGQILFEAAYQPAQPLMQNVQPVLQQQVFVEEIPKQTVVHEVIQQQVLPQQTFTQSSFVSRGGAIPVGSENLDGGLYGKVVHAEAVSHLPNQQFSGTGLHQETLPRTQLGGPLSGSLGGGVLGTRELGGQEILGGNQFVGSQMTGNQYGTQLPGSQMGGNQFMGNQPMSNQPMSNQFMGNQPMSNQSMGNQPMSNPLLGNQNVGSNLPTNFNSTSISNAQLGGGAPLYKETANHPTTSATTTKGKAGQALPNQGTIVPGDLIGGHSQTN